MGNSLDGEEGVLEYILSKLPSKDKYLVEFGAWDGIFLLNSSTFIKNQGYSGVLIEPDDSNFEKLKVNMKNYPGIECVKKFVTTQAGNKLDDILDNTASDIPTSFDLLIIDIDNNDYHVWSDMKKYSPKLVMIEINNTLLPTEEKVSLYDAEFVFGKHGSSIKSMTDLASKKGYKLIANVSCNAIYIKNEYYSLFFDKEFSIEDFYTFEGFNIKRWFLELSLHDKFRKFQEAIRRDKVLYSLNNLSAFLHIIKNAITRR